MGIFSKLFGKNTAAVPKCEPMTVYSPAEGTVIPLAEFPDAVFSQGVLGQCCGILPIGQQICAPFHGTVIQTSDTLHAVGLVSDDGVELLIHVGVDTVDMAGKGFEYHVKEGQKVHLGDPLITFNRETIQAAGHSDAIAVIVTNSDEYAGVELQRTGPVTQRTEVLKVSK